MLSDLMRAFGQLADPVSRRLLGRAMVITLGCFGILWVAASLALMSIGERLHVWAAARGWGEFWLGLIELVYGTAAFSGVIIASFLLFPAVIGIVLSVMLDPICEAVERRHYPTLPPAREQSLWEASIDGLRLAVVTVVVNLLVLPLYLVLMFFPPLNLFVFYTVNGYLLGREYFELAAVRRYDSRTVARLRRRHRGRVFVGGVIVAILLTLPVINLVMPIVATAFMLHLFEGLRRVQTGGQPDT